MRNIIIILLSFFPVIAIQAQGSRHSINAKADYQFDNVYTTSIGYNYARSRYISFSANIGVWQDFGNAGEMHDPLSQVYNDKLICRPFIEAGIKFTSPTVKLGKYEVAATVDNNYMLNSKFTKTVFARNIDDSYTYRSPNVSAVFRLGLLFNRGRKTFEVGYKTTNLDLHRNTYFNPNSKYVYERKHMHGAYLSIGYKL